MHGALERVEPNQRAPGFDAHHSAIEMEQDEQQQHAEDCNAADPMQRDLMEAPPIAAGGLLDIVGLDVRNAAAAVDEAHLAQELLLFHGAGGRIDRVSGIGLLGRVPDLDDDLG
jgi:hypothetical protein